MKNPFIILTGTNGRSIRINVHHIVTYDQRTEKLINRSLGQSAERYYTYIVLMGGNAITRNVDETPEQIDDLIAECYN